MFDGHHQLQATSNISRKARALLLYNTECGRSKWPRSQATAPPQMGNVGSSWNSSTLDSCSSETSLDSIKYLQQYIVDFGDNPPSSVLCHAPNVPNALTPNVPDGDVREVWKVWLDDDGGVECRLQDTRTTIFVRRLCSDDSHFIPYSLVKPQLYRTYYTRTRTALQSGNLETSMRTSFMAMILL